MKLIMLLTFACETVCVSSYDINFDQMRDDAIEKERQFLTLEPELEFTQKLKNINGSVRGPPITLTCKVSSTPTVSFVWHEDEDKIQGGIEVDVLEKGFNEGKYTIQKVIATSVYTIKCPNFEKSGTYSCMANNGHKIIRSEAIVQMVTYGERDDCPNYSNTKPSIITSTESRIEMETNSATLVCRADKGAFWSWEFKNRDLTKEDRYIIIPNGDIILENLTSADMGTYTCIARNQYGESRHDVFLNVTNYQD